ncbi:TetR/AcrR family transcriptional regulator [uncultured Ilumatobacter sp.]|uniref:TetR/AcrR family transcriptional regulator n=1 Tax=Ilumatobacter sp. TaxID=1967498 RepID=UPI003096456F|tara:strand:+ start:1462 stop:2130 length:669 start_codon:yes stop_codon:yes gene_type:complete
MSEKAGTLTSDPIAHGASPDQLRDEVVTGDGRVARRERNRSAVLDAVVELFEAGNTEPAVEDVAVLSGVSSRSIYRYFHHRDELVRAAMWHLRARVEPQMQLVDIGEGPLDERIDNFVAHRLAVFAVLAPITRAARRTANSLDLSSEEFGAFQMVLRQQFLDQFEPEFSTLAGRVLTRAVVAAEIGFQFDSLEYLFTSFEGNTDKMGHLLGRQLRIHLEVLR